MRLSMKNGWLHTGDLGLIDKEDLFISKEDAKA